MDKAAKQTLQMKDTNVLPSFGHGIDLSSEQIMAGFAARQSSYEYQAMLVSLASEVIHSLSLIYRPGPTKPTSYCPIPAGDCLNIRYITNPRAEWRDGMVRYFQRPSLPGYLIAH